MRLLFFIFFLLYNSFLLSQHKVIIDTMYIDSLTEELKILKQENNLRQWLETKWAIARQYSVNSNRKKANEILNQGLANQWRTSEKREEYESVIKIFMSQAFNHSKLSQYPKAQKFYESALQIAYVQNIETYRIARYLYKPLANIHSRNGDYHKAIELLDKTLKIAKAEDDQGLVERTLIDQGIAYFYQGELEKAIGNYQTVLKNPNLSNRNKGWVYANLSQAYTAKRDYEKALAVIEIANEGFLADLKDAETPADTVVTWTNLQQNYQKIGGIYTQQKQYIKAEKAYQTALQQYGIETPNREKGKIYNDLGDLYFQQNQTDKALEQYHKALQQVLPNLLNTPKTLPTLQQLYPENTIAETLWNKIKVFQKKYQKAQNTEWLNKALTAYDLIFQTQRLLLNTFEYEQAKLQLLANNHENYEAAIALCYELYAKTTNKKYLVKAFQYSEDSRAFLLMESMRKLSEVGANILPQEILEKEQTLQKIVNEYEQALVEGQLQEAKDLTEIERNLFLNRQSLDSLKAVIATDYPNYHQLKYQHQAISLKEAQAQLLDRKTAMLSFFYGQAQVFIFVITKKSIELKRVGEVQKIDELITAFRQGFDGDLVRNQPDDAYQQYSENAYQLYQNLLASAFTPSKNIQNIIILPDGKLNYLPFELLLSEKPSTTTNYQGLAYFFQDRNIRYAYSATWLSQLSNLSIHEGNSVGFAPSFTGDLSPLVFANQEVESLLKYFEGNAFEDKKASKSTLLTLNQPQNIVHLALHALVDQQDYFKSKLAFTNTDTSDYLYQYELYNLRLQANLVVLSACETGLGAMKAGEGVMSLARGFAFAGSPATIMSHWNLNDETTVTLMDDFYKNLSQGMMKSEALRAAKNDFVQTASPLVQHPYYWGSLVLVGSDVAVVSKTGNLWIWIVGLLLLIGVVFWKKR